MTTDQLTYPTPTLDQILIWYRELEQGGLYNAESHHSWPLRRGRGDATTTTTKGSVRFPKIVLKDGKGRELDTESVYQNAIYEAKWKLTRGELPRYPEEWRLPHAPAPARPDFSRQIPPGIDTLRRIIHPKRIKKSRHSRSHTWGHEYLSNVDFEGAPLPTSFSFQSINTLPGLETVTDDAVNTSTSYIPIVDSVKFFKKELTETDKREPTEHHPPGYRPSTQKAELRVELCYGCERGSAWHYHQDKPVRTGGGYTYMKRDIPANKMKGKGRDKKINETEVPENVFYHGAQYPDLEKFGIAIKVSKVMEGHKKVPPITSETETKVKTDDDNTTQYHVRKEKPYSEKLYKAPEPFTLKKSEKIVTQAVDPFSTDRTFNLNHGDGFKVKKSDKELTKFEDFDKIEPDYKPPESFVLKKREEPRPQNPKKEQEPQEVVIPQPTVIRETTPIDVPSPIVEPVDEATIEPVDDPIVVPVDELPVETPDESKTSSVGDEEDEDLPIVFEELPPENSPEIELSLGTPDSGVESTPAPHFNLDTVQSPPVQSPTISINRNPTPIPQTSTADASNIKTPISPLNNDKSINLSYPSTSQQQPVVLLPVNSSPKHDTVICDDTEVSPNMALTQTTQSPLVNLPKLDLPETPQSELHSASSSSFRTNPVTNDIRFSIESPLKLATPCIPDPPMILGYPESPLRFATPCSPEPPVENGLVPSPPLPYEYPHSTSHTIKYAGPVKQKQGTTNIPIPEEPLRFATPLHPSPLPHIPKALPPETPLREATPQLPSPLPKVPPITSVDTSSQTASLPKSPKPESKANKVFSPELEKASPRTPAPLFVVTQLMAPKSPETIKHVPAISVPHPPTVPIQHQVTDNETTQTKQLTDDIDYNELSMTPDESLTSPNQSPDLSNDQTPVKSPKQSTHDQPLWHPSVTPEESTTPSQIPSSPATSIKSVNINPNPPATVDVPESREKTPYPQPVSEQDEQENLAAPVLDDQIRSESSKASTINSLSPSEIIADDDIDHVTGEDVASVDGSSTSEHGTEEPVASEHGNTPQKTEILTQTFEEVATPSMHPAYVEMPPSEPTPVPEQVIKKPSPVVPVKPIEPTPLVVKQPTPPAPQEIIEEIKQVEKPKVKKQPPPLPARKPREAGRKPPPPKPKTPPPPPTPPKVDSPPKSPSPIPSPVLSLSEQPEEPDEELEKAAEEEEADYVRVEESPEPTVVALDDLLPPPKAKPQLKTFVNTKLLKRKKPRAIPEPQPVQPISWKEIREINDPLDYLAKYCIIHPERLPYYERVFHNTITKQEKRYQHVPATWEDNDEKEEDENRTPTPDPNKIMFRDMKLISRAPDFDSNFGMGRGACDVLVDKGEWSVEEMKQKYEELEARINELEVDRKRFILTAIRDKFPQLLRYDYDAFAKSTKKGKKKKKAKTPTLVTEVTERQPLSVEDIIDRLDSKMWNNVKANGEVNMMEAEIKICEEKLVSLNKRMHEVKGEKRVLEFCGRDEYMDNQLEGLRSPAFRRRQSALYNRTHPVPNVELNVEEIENALQVINGQLVTDKEMQYIYQVLDLPGKKRLSMKLFSAVAALSEKVKQLDPFLRKIINRFDFEALDIKMSKCKELYYLLNTKEQEMPDGNVTAQSLAVELAAGGMTPDHVQYVVNKFNREKGGYIEFLDFLTYIPLFIEIHSRIIDDPLNEKKDL